MSGKGFAFRGNKKKVEEVPEQLRETIVQERDSIKAAKITTAVRSMFGRPAAPVQPTYSKGAVATAKEKKAEKQATERAQKPQVSATALSPVESAPVVPPIKNLVQGAFEDIPAPTNKFTDDLLEMATLIEQEEGKNPYEQPEAPKTYVPETRRGFSEFIKETYDEFMLKTGDDREVTPAGEKYPYQKFIREYMRQASPYRGILVYHGLGSGKTCTSIATAEALFSTANKKIIVMTPFSLRKNFLKEVSLCGFRHFRLSNFWVPLPVADPTNRLFATSILGLSEQYLRTAQNIWVPDFRKGTTEANYSTLGADEQTEIRKQILSILVWDPVKNPYGRIRFINYNGISAKKLQAIACNKPYADFFDDAVVIVDEIHNLVRLMEGTIEPYLTRMKGLRRLIPLEEITPNKWNPTLCLQGSKTYSRGYIFYRLLLDARNTKIVGLSGTPLINFPEELGILMNVLHGYIPTIEMTVEKVGKAAQEQCAKVLSDFPYTDFVRAWQDPTGNGTRVMCTLLPYGVRKIAQDVGVERIPADEDIPPIDAIVADIQKTMTEAGLSIRGAPTLKALPLLPPFGESFRETFVNPDNSGLRAQNKIVLIKRLTGLISYYKGSNEDLMPRIKVDEVVRVPMSVYSQKMYVEARESEISSEKKKENSKGGMGGVWSDVFEVGAGAQSSNYKMASRQACNFTFPPTVRRPRPLTKKELNAEAEAGNVRGDLIDTAPDSEAKGAEEFPEMEAEDAQDEAEAAVAAEDDAAIEAEMLGEEDTVQTGGDLSANTVTDDEEQLGGQPSEEAVQVPPDETTSTLQDLVPTTSTATRKPFIMKGLLAKKAAALQSDCKSGQKPGEDYRAAIARAKECLGTLARDQMKAGPEGLSVYSPKFVEIFKRIEGAPGSSLVYSQFLDMEGIGIFRIAMDINGYAPIEIIKTPTGPKFSAKTEASLRKGPGKEFRYITFSGGEEEDIRRLSLDIFNAKLDELPQNLKSLLEELGYADNLVGQLCRVFCITSAGAEGISLKSVRAVHIMEPYWNDVRTRQVKGRAIRIGSHLDLPPEERNVSIYTYLTVFSKEAQIAKSGEFRIDETIRQGDRVERKDALAIGLPIDPKASDYIITTDERLFIISERKKQVLNALESTMKAAAIDCELNFQENKDGTFKCLPLRGKVGDFLYHPDLATDISESASQFKIQEEPAVAAKPLAPTYIKQKLRDKIYLMKYVRAAPGAPVTGFEMYDEKDTEMKTLLGTTGVNPKSAPGDERPGPPIKMVAQ